MLKDNIIVIESLSLEEYLKLHSDNYSADSLEFDDPDRPIPSIEDEISWWNEKVHAGDHIVKSIKIGEEIVGLLHAFDFKENQCEIGINIFPKSNWNRGIAKFALKKFISFLFIKHKVSDFIACTNINNIGALKVFHYLGFSDVEVKKEGKIVWSILKYHKKS